MIKKLQRKFVLIAMLSMAAVTIIIITTINLVNIYRTNSQIDFMLELIAENNGDFPKFQKKDGNSFITQETEHSTRYLSVIIDSEGEIVSSNLEHIISVKDDNLKQTIASIENQNKNKGYYENFRYLIADYNNDEHIIILLDSSIYIHEINTILIYSCIIALVSLSIVFILVSIFSKRAITPVIANIEKQKQFVTDAGHELKTPVAIILANLDVLEMKNGTADEWIISIRNQAKRLDTLIKRLLRLSKGGEKQIKIEEINISELLNDVLDDFEVLIANKKVEKDIINDIKIKGDYETLHELITILIDNAIKYVSDDGKITVNLSKNSKEAKIDIANNYEELSKEECNRLFERFYRKDKSRDRKTGGYGIGLSMAKAMVRQNSGRINAIYNNGMIHFIITLKLFETGKGSNNSNSK